MTRKDRPNSGWTRVFILVSLALSSFLVAVARSDLQDGKQGRKLGQETVAPIAAIASIPIQSVEGFFQGLSDRASVYEDNESLKAELAVLRERQSRYENLAMKVARYETILGVDTNTDIPLQKVATRAIGESDGPFVRSLLINVGKSDGVAIGNPVLSSDGMVGHIINAGPRSSRVLMLSDLNSRIPVASSRSGATAILAGDNSTRPRLSFISERLEWKVGDQVITSGDDGSLPRGLRIGDVIRLGDDELRVQLASQENPIDWVWVSPYEPITAPPETESDEIRDQTDGNAEDQTKDDPS